MQNSIGLPGDINNDTSSGDQLGFFFPWYGSDISSLSQGFNISSGFNASHELSSAFSSFRGFYANPGPEPAQRMGDTPVIIQTSMKGYDVYLYGALLGKEGTGGDDLDVSSNSM